MKHAKRLASLLLALTLVLAMAAPAMAAGAGTITVDNPREGQDYIAYKIFDVNYNENKTAYTYTIAGDSPWFDVVTKTEEDKLVSAVPGLTITKAPGTANTYVVTKVEGFSAASFANTLKESISGKQGTELAVSGGKATATGLDLGYYFVTSTTGALCNLTTTNPTVTIHDKNDVPFEKTEDKASVEVGEIVNYVITGKVPDTTGFEKYTYQIADKMSDGLTFNNDVKVFIGEQEIHEGFTLKTGADAGGKNFVLDIDVMHQTFGAKIEVKYSATVNENAVTKVEKNQATLKYSDDPTQSDSTKELQDEEKVYSAKIVIDKYAAGDNTKKLAGAKFKLYKNVTKEEGEAAVTTRSYYYYNKTNDKVEWKSEDEKADATEVTTDSKGAAEFIGLKDGEYYLEETAAPTGYNLLTEPVKITIAGKNAVETAASGLSEDQISTLLTVTGNVANQSGTELPSTGGMGTTVLYVVGGILLVGAAVLLITRGRMNAGK